MSTGANTNNFNGNYPEQRYHFNACPLLLPSAVEWGGRGRIDILMLCATICANQQSA
jgi:hypothetical protein